MRHAAALALLLALAAPAAAQETGVAEDLAAADRALKAADSNLEQRRAATDAIRAYERAARSLRASIEDLAARRRAAERRLAAEEARLTRVATGLALAGRWAEPALLAPARDPAEMVRAMLMMERAAQGLQARTDRLARERGALTALQAQREDALRELERAVDRLAALRAKLIAWADAGRTDTAAVPDLGEDASNLADLAIALSASRPAAAPPPADALPRLAPPVPGPVVRGFGAEDPAGLSRPGVVFSAAPGALVTAPAAGTVRFAGRLDGYGRVVILEPAEQALLVLAGLGPVLVRPGGQVERGAALGFLPGEPAPADPGTENSPADRAAAGQRAAKTLYMETRLRQRPVDPARWLEPTE